MPKDRVGEIFTVTITEVEETSKGFLPKFEEEGKTYGISGFDSHIHRIKSLQGCNTIIDNTFCYQRANSVMENQIIIVIRIRPNCSHRRVITFLTTGKNLLNFFILIFDL